MAQQAGLPFHALGTRERHLCALDDPALWDSRKSFGVAWRTVRDVPEHMGAFIDALPRISGRDWLER
jgi:hypothetical protein